jgi:hypothetical protein
MQIPVETLQAAAFVGLGVAVSAVIRNGRKYKPDKVWKYVAQGE